MKPDEIAKTLADLRERDDERIGEIQELRDRLVQLEREFYRFRDRVNSRLYDLGRY